MARRTAIAGRDAEAAGTTAPSNSVRMPIEEAVRLAVATHRAGHHERAEALYRAVLKAEPRHPRANHFFGVLLNQTDRMAQSLIHLRRSLTALSDQGWAWNNLGNALWRKEEQDEAEQAYQKALALDPDLVDAHNNLSVIRLRQDRCEEARSHVETALRLKPNDATALVNRGHILMKMKEPDEAMESFSRAVLLSKPSESARSRRSLGAAHVTLKQFDQAAAVYRDWLKHEPGNATATHLLMACLGENVAERASDAYVAETFDRFANSFDNQLARLGYRAPELIADALAAAYPAHASYGVVADAGCGTGLCAPLLRSRSKRLVGVDLSAGMLAKAKERGGYDELHEGELTAFLLERRSAFDTIVCADTLCYFGVLDAFMEAAHGSMKPGGVLAFTVEQMAESEGAPYRLQFHGRYCHSRPYVEQTLARIGFGSVSLTTEALRDESGKPVIGWVVTATRD